MIEQIIEQFADDELLIADGFDDAIIGIDCSSFNCLPRLIYSVRKCLEILMKEMTYEEALEHFDYNVRGAYVGPKTPIWCDDDFI